LPYLSIQALSGGRGDEKSQGEEERNRLLNYLIEVASRVMAASDIFPGRISL